MVPSDEESDALFRALFHGTADMVVVIDDAGVIVLANEACARLLGHPPGSLVGRKVEALIPPRFSAHPKLREEYARSPRPRAMGRGLSLFALHADGREIPVDIALTPLTLGSRRWTACSLRDMRGKSIGPDTLRVQATALRSAANGVVITDHKGVITWVNPAACTITGYQADEMIGMHTRLLKSGEHAPEFYANLWKTISRGETWSGTIVNRRKDGSTYHEEQTIAPVVDEHGGVTHYIAIKQDVTERHRNEHALATAHAKLGEYVVEIESLNRRLREQAIRDPLTGLHNRRFFEEAAARDLARAIRKKEPLAIVMLDIDHFKSINDTYGHAAGDAVLRQIAAIIRANVRAADLICRYGGEEFVAMLPGATLEAACDAAELWRTAVAGASIDAAGDTTVTCTISLGVALLAHGNGDNLGSVLRRADAALYEAKRRGRNRTAVEGA